MIRIGVVGTGSAGSRHLLVLRECDGVIPIAIPVRPTGITSWQHQGFETASSLRKAELLDAVVVATDTSRHMGDILEALDCGARFVLAEKPIATCVSEVVHAFQKYPDITRRVFVGYDLRFSPSLHLFRSHLENIGPIHEVSIECRSYLPDWRPDRDYRETYAARLAEGGVLRDLSHEIDYACWLFGQPREDSLVASLRRSGCLEIEGEDQATLIWESEAGSRINISLDYLSRVTVRRMTAYGAEGNLSWDAVAQTVSLLLKGQDPQVHHQPVESMQLYRSQIGALLSVCHGGSGGCLATFEEALATLRMCDAAFKFQETLNIRGRRYD